MWGDVASWEHSLVQGLLNRMPGNQIVGLIRCEWGAGHSPSCWAVGGGHMESLGASATLLGGRADGMVGGLFWQERVCQFMYEDGAYMGSFYSCLFG
jgi:hypothetical protein